MIAFIPARRHKKTAASAPRPCRQPHHRRYTAWLLSLVLCLNSIAPALATVHEVLTATVIGQDLALEPQFEKAHGGLHGYRARGYLASAEASGYYGLADFYRRLKREHRAALGPPRRIRLPFEDLALTVPVYPRFRYLGTPFVQSRYLRRQINRLLRRTLIDADRPGFGSEREQTRTLYDNAFTFARANSQLRLGAALPHSRIDAPVDMIWPEQRNLQGETLLVPVLYLTRATWEARRVEEPAWTFNGPAHIDRLNLERATLTTGRAAWIEAVNGITLNGGQILSSGDLTLVAGGAFTNLSGQVVVEGDLTVVAQRIENRTLVYRFERGGNVDERYGAIAAIEAGNVTFRSFSDIVMAGAEIHAGKDIRFAADGNIYVGPVPLNRRQLGRDGHWHEHSQNHVHYLRSRLSAKDSIQFIAGGNIVIDAADIVAERGHIELLADYGISVVDSLAESHYQRKGTFGQASVEEEAYKTVAMRALLDAGKGLVIHSTLGDITLKSARIHSGDGARVQADQGKIHLLVTRETDHYRYSEVKKDLFTAATLQRGQQEDTVVHTTVVGGLQTEALYGLHVEYRGDPELGLDEQVAQLARLPGLAWMAQVRQDFPGTDWRPIEARYTEWQHSSKGISPAMAAMISVVVAVASSGSSAGWLDAALAAGQASVVTQVALAVANGVVTGDLAEAMDDLVSSDTLRAVVQSALVAGALHAIDARFFNEGSAPGSSLGRQARQALAHSTVRAGVSTLMDGGNLEDLGDRFARSLVQTAVQTLGTDLAKEIGAARRAGDISQWTQYMAHAAVGCLTGTVDTVLHGGESSLGCASGAGGAVVGEIIGEAYQQSLQDDLSAWLEGMMANGERPPLSAIKQQATAFKQRGVNLARLGAALAAFTLGGDPSTASFAGANAAENNALGLGFLVTAVLAAAYTAYVSYTEGDGDLMEGIRAIGRGDDPLARTINEQTTAAVTWASAEYPEATANVAAVLGAVGHFVGQGVAVAMETPGGKLIVKLWSSLDREEQEALLGAGNIIAFIVPGGVVDKLRTLSKVDTVELGEWLRDLNHPNWEKLDPEVKERLLADGAHKEGIWALRPIDRGNLIEAQLAETEYRDWFNIGQLDGGTFPLVDFQKGKELVSLKTIDTNGKTWMRRMREHIDALAESGLEVDGQPAILILDIRVQPGGASAAEPLRDYGDELGIKVTIEEY